MVPFVSALPVLVACGAVHACGGVLLRRNASAPAGGDAQVPARWGGGGPALDGSGTGPQAAGESFSARLRYLAPVDRLERISPVAWVQVSRSGTTLMNAVLHLPGVCPGIGVAESDYLCSSENPDCSGRVFAMSHGANPYTPAFCRVSKWVGHQGFGTEYEFKKGHGFAMFQQPEQRILDSFFNPRDDRAWQPNWGVSDNVMQFAKLTAGLAVRTLVRDIVDQPEPQEVSPSEAQLAAQRLREGFAFVGLTEQHELSVCLLHKMFGGECDAHEFLAGRQGAQEAREYDAEAYLGGWRDEADNVLYDEAKLIFQRNLHAYDVSWSTCHECFTSAGYVNPAWGKPYEKFPT